MSWFTDIAGKAENFLNQIDQNAAVALNINSKSEKEQRPRKTEPFLEPQSQQGSNFSSVGSTRATDHSSAIPRTNEGNISSNSASNSTSNSVPNNEESRKSNNSKRQTGKSLQTAIISTENISSSNSSKLKDSMAAVKNKSVIQNGVDKNKTSNNSSTSTSITTANQGAPSEEDLIAYLNSSASDSNGVGLNESMFLKEEVDSQAKELKLLTKNHRGLQKDYDELKQKLEIYKDKLVQAETIKQSSEAEEKDLHKVLQDKVEEVRDLSAKHQQALEALQKLELSQENVQKLEHCLLENSHLKSENDSLTQRTELLSSQVETAEAHVLSMKSTLSSMEKEFTNYKEKAKSILSYKDELIANLKGDDSSSPRGDISSNTAEELHAEVTALKNERELLQADLSQTRAVVDSLKEDNIRLEKEVNTLRCFTEDLGVQLKREKETVSQLQSENLQVCQQLQSVQFELERERNERKKLQELVAQYKRPTGSSHTIDSNVTNGSVFGVNNSLEKELSKLKTRISALSQSLYEKQSLINDLSTDKQLLQIQVERLKNDLKECRVENNDFCHGGVLPQTVIASQPLYLSESPWDSRVSARMKRMYTQLDAVFCQFGLALRKRPNLRLGMSLYVIFLHLWVFFVLFSWMHHATPE